MKELSLNILDIVQNSVKAGATRIEICLEETDERFSFWVRDNGCGMSEELLSRVKDPFATTRTTRNVGLGIPLLTLAAEQTGGGVSIESSTGEDHGTLIRADFNKRHIDFTPLGDIVSTVTTVIQGNPDTDVIFSHSAGEGRVELSTPELREVLDGVSLSEPEVLAWIEDNLRGQYDQMRMF